MTTAKLAVWLDAQLTGSLEQDASGRMLFTYQPGCSRALSLSMPLREPPYGHDVCESYFGGLLPESEHARQLIGKRFGINANNSFSLLRAIGHECAGAVSIQEWEMDAPPSNELRISGRILSEGELAAQIRDLPRRPLLLGVDGIRLSLAGAADKAAVCMIDGSLALPEPDSPTTHILKPDIADVGQTTANEYFCLTLAARIGLTAAPVSLRKAEDVSYLLVERYDRARPGGPLDLNIRRIHQEDFCQALGISSARKYQSEGGPGYRDCFDLLQRVSRPAVDRMSFARSLIFNFLVGNMDAHGKNFSLLHAGPGNVRLSPLYDIVSTRVYPDLSRKMAMKVDKYYDPEDIFPRHWQRMCEASGFSYPVFRRMFLQTIKEIRSTSETLRDECRKDSGIAYGVETFDRIVSYIDLSCKSVESRFARESPQKTVS